MLARPSAHATDIAMTATIERSIPRPITTTAMPTPRMPSTATLRTSVRTFPAVRKFGRVAAKVRKSSTASAKTICSWLRRLIIRGRPLRPSRTRPRRAWLARSCPSRAAMATDQAAADAPAPGRGAADRGAEAHAGRRWPTPWGAEVGALRETTDSRHGVTEVSTQAARTAMQDQVNALSTKPSQFRY